MSTEKPCYEAEMPMRSPPTLEAMPQSSRSPSNLRDLLLSIGGFWVFYFIINTVRVSVAGAQHQVSQFDRRIIVTLAGMLLSVALYGILRPLEAASMTTRVGVAFSASIPVALAYGAFNYVAFHVFDPQPWLPTEPDLHPALHLSPIATIVDAAVNWYFFIVAWAVLYIALSNADKTRLAERQAAAHRVEAQQAQLRALRYQLNPHFLFNTLNALSSIIMSGHAEQAESMIIGLSDFLRITLTTDPTEDVPLCEEVRMQLLYLQIEQARFPERLRVYIDVPTDLEAAHIPALLLQPLIENAVKYGVSPTSTPVTITIRASRV